MTTKTGDKAITLELAPCDPTRPTTFTLSLAGTAEVNGDHVATIDFAANDSVAWAMLVNEVEVPIGGSASFLFTSAGETYTLVARPLGTIPENETEWEFPPMPYGVAASYAPGWAQLEGTITATYERVEVICPNVRSYAPRVSCEPPDEFACYVGSSLYVIPVFAGDVCAEAITGVTLHCNVLTFSSGNCTVTSTTDLVMIKYNATYIVCGATHEDSSTLLSGTPFWAVTGAPQYTVTGITVTTVAGTKTCTRSIPRGTTTFDAISVATSCTYLMPYYEDTLTPTVKTPIASKPLADGGPGGFRSTFGTYVDATHYHYEWDSLVIHPVGYPPTPAVSTVTIAEYSRDFWNSVISISGTCVIPGSVYSASCSATVTYSITKPCGSNIVTFTIGDVNVAALDVVIELADELDNTTSTTSTIGTLVGMGAGGTIELVVNGGMWYNPSFSAYLNFHGNAGITLYKGP